MNEDKKLEDVETLDDLAKFIVMTPRPVSMVEEDMLHVNEALDWLEQHPFEDRMESSCNFYLFAKKMEKLIEKKKGTA